MRESVTINNVTLTRAQIEEAMGELDAPEVTVPPGPKPGTFGTPRAGFAGLGRTMCMVVHEDITDRMTPTSLQPHVRFTNGRFTYTTPIENWESFDFAPAFTR